jgi:pimeloyl-ACP methyl ester carboxylesterase
LREAVKLSPESVAQIKASPGWARTYQRMPEIVREMAALQAWRPDSESYRELQTPVLFLSGALTPAGHHHRGYLGLLRGLAPDFSAIELPGQEHNAHREAPELFASTVLNFLKADLENQEE